jgi:DNA-binding FadR family transcriptional regulator
MDRVRLPHMGDTDMIGILVSQHVQIAESVNARKPRAAEDAMREHPTPFARHRGEAPGLV